MTLNVFYTKLKSDLKNIETTYRGFVITELSMPNFERNSKGIYNNSIYVDASNSNQSIKLLINLAVLEEAYKDGYTINESVSVDVTIDTITVDSRGTVLIKISKIAESGISEQELFIRNLTAHCKENKLFDRPKKSYPSLVKKIALISTINTNTLEDIINSLDYTLETSSFKVQNTSNAIAKQIKLCNNEDYDLLLLYRGGHEDKSMNIYSDIPVLNAIHESNIHIGVALGHEVDIPFVYRIADSTYSTPTNFAQVINSHNQNVKNIFNGIVLNIKVGIENLKSKIQNDLYSIKIDNIYHITNKLNSNVKLFMEKIYNHSNKAMHLYELEIENNYSSINSKQLLLISKIKQNILNSHLNIKANQELIISNISQDLKSIDNRINTLVNEIILKSDQKKNSKIKLILTVTLAIATIIILYLLFRQ